MQRERFRIADLIVDIDAVSVCRDGQRLQLPKLSFDLLVVLARRAPAVVPFEELIATVWQGLAISDETLTQRVALLRRALGEEAKSPRYVRAVRGRGYQLIPEVSTLSEEKPPGPVPRRRRIAMALAAAMLLAAAAAVVVPLLRGRAVEGAAERSPVSTQSPSVPELLVRAGSYLRQHQESDNELAIGLYRRAVQLQPDNPRALAGLSLAYAQRATKFNRREATQQAMDLAQRAVALDPRLGQAHQALGLALDSRGQIKRAIAAYLRAADLGPDSAPALASAAHLMRVQGRLAEALEADLRVAAADGEAPVYLEVQIGNTLALLGFDQAAATWFERAMELRPDNVFAAASYAQMLLSQARLREADAVARRAIERGIRRPELPTIRGTVALLEGDAQRACQFFEDARLVAPAFLRSTTRLLLLTRGSGIESRRRELIASLQEARKQGDEWPDPAIDQALLAASLGDDGAAIRAIDTAIDLGYRDEDWLLLDPGFARLRSSPEMTRRIERIRLLVHGERQRVLDAAWLPPSLLDGSAARM